MGLLELTLTKGMIDAGDADLANAPVVGIQHLREVLAQGHFLAIARGLDVGEIVGHRFQRPGLGDHHIGGGVDSRRHCEPLPTLGGDVQEVHMPARRAPVRGRIARRVPMAGRLLC